MTGDPRDRPPEDGPPTGEPPFDARAEALLAEATEQLRVNTDPRWVEVAPRVLRAALSAPRRSHPVLGQAPGGPMHVSEQVIVARLQDALGAALEGVAVRDILLEVTGREELTAVTIDVAVRYGMPILPAADRLRELARETLFAVLGVDAPVVHVRPAHVHVSDVTVDDPHLVDPPPRDQRPG